MNHLQGAVQRGLAEMGADLPQEEVSSNLSKGLELNCHGCKVAIPHEQGRQTLAWLDVVPVPRAPAWLTGVANMNGQVLPVIDLSVLMSESPAGPSTRRLPWFIQAGSLNEPVLVPLSSLPRLVSLRKAINATWTGPMAKYVIGSVDDTQGSPAIDLCTLLLDLRGV